MYEVPVAVVICVQLAGRLAVGAPTAVEHRHHELAPAAGLVGVGNPIHSPATRVRVPPTSGAPEIRGSTLTVGGIVTCAVEMEVCESLPKLFVAVSKYETNFPASSARRA